jgi:hypothetical protein
MSDLSIVWLVRSLAPLHVVRASLVGVCLAYVLCGAAAVLLLPITKSWRDSIDWLYAAPYAASWFVGMVFLFSCFAVSGVVYGNILQSTRGIMSVLIGAVLARAGMVELEQAVARRVFVQRAAAAVLMTLAVWLFQS